MTAVLGQGKSVQQTHAHMHTAAEAGSINVERVQDLVMNYTWAPLEADDSVTIEGPESISLEDIEAEFARLDAQGPESSSSTNGDNLPVDTPIEKVYDLSILDAIKAGKATTLAAEETDLTAKVGTPAEVWDPTTLLRNLGM